MKGKKILILLLLIAALFSLAACGPKTGTSAVTTTPSQSDPTAPSSTAVTQQPAGEVNIQELASGAWENPAQWEMTMPLAFSDTGLYFIKNDSFLCFWDDTSGSSITLCQKAGCLHEDTQNHKEREDCEANFGTLCELFFFWNGKLYYGLSDNFGYQLYCRNADGTGEEKVATLFQQYISSKQSVTINQQIIADGTLYLWVTVSKREASDSGTQITDYSAIVRFDLVSKTEQTVFTKEEGGLRLICAKKNAVLFQTIDSHRREDGLEGKYNSTVTLQLWTADANTTKTVLETTYRELPSVRNFQNGEIYAQSIDADVGYVQNLITGQCRAYAFPGNLIFGDYYKTYNSETKEWSVFHAQSEQLVENELSDTSAQILSANARGFVVKLSYYDSERTKQVYTYVAYDNIADGLQKEDFVEIISRN